MTYDDHIHKNSEAKLNPLRVREHDKSGNFSLTLTVVVVVVVIVVIVVIVVEGVVVASSSSEIISY